MKHYGDITKLSGAELPVVDCITGGSPCQDLSVAGKRAGLAGARSGLFMEQIRIIKEMRENDKRTGRSGVDVRPRYAIWENVPGALSSPGKNNPGADFAAVIEEFIKAAEPGASVDVRVPDGGWPKAGCYYAEDGSWSLAWRVHDAQYHGVPQRRKRIGLLVDFGGLTAPGIVFDPEYRRATEDGDPVSLVSDPGAEPRSEVQPFGESLPGYSGESGEAGQGTAEGTERGAGEPGAYTLKIRGGVDRDSSGRKAGKGALIQTELSGTLGVSQDRTLIQPCLNPRFVDVYNQEITGEVAASLTASAGGTNTSGPKVMSAGFKPRNGSEAKSIGYEKEKSPTISTDENYAALVAGFKGGQSAGGLGYEKEMCPTLTSPPPGIEPTVLVDSYQKVTGPLLASGYSKLGTQEAMNGMYVVPKEPIMVEMSSTKNTVIEDGISCTLTARMGTGGNQVNAVVSEEPMVLESNQNHATVTKTGVCNTLPSSMGMGGGYTPMIVDALPFDTTQVTSDKNWSHPKYGDPCHPLAAGMHPPAVAFSQNQREEVRMLGDAAGGLSANGGSHQQTYVAYGIDQQGGKGGANYSENICPPILSDSHGTPHAIAYGISAFDSNAMKSSNPHSGIYEAYTSRTLDLNGGSPACNQGGIAVVEAVPIEGNGTRASHRGDGYGAPGDPMFTLNTTEQHKVAAPVECLGVGFFQATEDKTPALLARDYKDPHIVNRSSTVRRLTPKECERLQGFPDGWTDLGEWTDSQGKKHKDADSPRYKALGNSIALPWWSWLAGRICAEYDRQVTIGSLFDGIGGFPLVFERHGGKALWASEIEEFAIAVTKKHFPEQN